MLKIKKNNPRKTFFGDFQIPKQNSYWSFWRKNFHPDVNLHVISQVTS